MQFTPALRQALRLLDAAPSRLRRVVAPPRPTDLLDGPPSRPSIYHPIPVVIACLDGPLRVRVRGARFDLGPGEAVVIPAATWYSRDDHSRQMTVGFGWLGSAADLWLNGPDISLWATLPLDPASSLIRRCAAAQDDATRLVSARELLRAVADEDLDNLRSLPPTIERMIDVITHRLHTAPTADDVVRASGLGRSQAYALFTGVYGLPPRVAIELRRLELAGALLAAGHGVAATAAACGWSCRETFSRAWSRHHGMPPRNVRISRSTTTSPT